LKKKKKKTPPPPKKKKKKKPTPPPNPSDTQQTKGGGRFISDGELLSCKKGRAYYLPAKNINTTKSARRERERKGSDRRGAAGSLSSLKNGLFVSSSEPLIEERGRRHLRGEKESGAFRRF